MNKYVQNLPHSSLEKMKIWKKIETRMKVRPLEKVRNKIN